MFVFSRTIRVKSQVNEHTFRPRWHSTLVKTLSLQKIGMMRQFHTCSEERQQGGEPRNTGNQGWTQGPKVWEPGLDPGTQGLGTRVGPRDSRLRTRVGPRDSRLRTRVGSAPASGVCDACSENQPSVSPISQQKPRPEPGEQTLQDNLLEIFEGRLRFHTQTCSSSRWSCSEKPHRMVRPM